MHRSDDYDQKTDIFSLGLIYLSLLWDFERDMTKAQKMFDHLRANEEQPKKELFELLKQNYGNMDFEFLKSMLKRNSSERPSAAEALRQLDQPKQFARKFED